MKILLDTSALIDLVAPRNPWCEDIKKLCIASVFEDIQIWISAQSYTDAYYVLERNSDADSVKKALLATLDFFYVCDTYASELRPALESDWKDIEGYLIAHTSKHIPADYLITRDKELIEHSPIKAVTAGEFLAILQEDHGLSYDGRV